MTTSEEKKLPHENPEMLQAHEELKLLTETQGQRISDLENIAKRLQADFDNFRKQTDKEKAALYVRAAAVFLAKLLPVLDEFSHSLEEAKKHHAGKEVVHGFEMVYGNLRKTLETEGLKEMKTENERFDPYKHESIRQEESNLEEGKILSVVRKGYYFHDDILRHARVVISRGKKEGGKEHGK